MTEKEECIPFAGHEGLISGNLEGMGTALVSFPLVFMIMKQR